MDEKTAELWALSLYYQKYIYIIKEKNFTGIKSDKLSWYIAPEATYLTEHTNIIEVISWRDFGFSSIDMKFCKDLKNMLIKKY